MKEQCAWCGEYEDLNEYDLCEKCEEEVQKEKKDIQDTQDSDLRQ